MSPAPSKMLVRGVAALGIAIALMLAVTLYASSGDTASASKHSQWTAKPLAGAWQTNVTFTSSPPPQVPTGKEAAVQGFGRDGLVSESATVSAGSGYGQWKPNGKPRGFDYTFHENIPLPNGDFLMVVVKQTGSVSPDGKAYTSAGSGQVYTSAGAPAGPPSQTKSVGTRITL